jgi:UPF0755 protein
MAEDTRPHGTAPDVVLSRSANEAAAPIGRAEPSRITPRSARTRLEPERVPQPSRPSRRARHPIVIAGNAVFTTIILLAVTAGIALAVGKQRFESPGPLAEDRTVNIPRGGMQDMADQLVREGVIDQKWVFIGGVLVTKSRDDLKSGEYLFHKNASLREVIDTISEGKVVQHQVTLPEGLTSEQMIARLLETDTLSGTIKEIPREGTILPETYRFTRGFPREQLVQRMQQTQRRTAQEIWDRRSPDLPVKTLEQLIVLASIVEKETGRGDERARVAAVFVNRLRQGMKLQSDPTIIYGLVGGKGTLGRPIMRSEIEQPTPYNTYVIAGLPPGPIANPGRAALEATANPSRTKELYFVADGSGGHAFAETLDQHQRNVARLRQLERGGAVRNQETPAPAYAPETQTQTPVPPVTGGGRPPARAQGAAPTRPQRQQ